MILDRNLVIAKIDAMFPRDQRDGVLAELDRYPGDTPHGRARVQLAVLKLAQGDRTGVGALVDLAVQDFRDVLAPAEYPHQTAMGFVNMDRLSAADRDALIRKDAEQWHAWLGS